MENPGRSDNSINHNMFPHTTTTSVNQKYLEQREKNQANKVSRIVKEAMSEHDAGRMSQQHGLVSKKASSTAGTGTVKGKPLISSTDANTIYERLDNHHKRVTIDVSEAKKSEMV